MPKAAISPGSSPENGRHNADNAYRESLPLSPEQFIQLAMIKMQQQVCGKDGKATCTFVQNGVAQVYTLGK